jgi:hypothetical protein
VVKLLFAAAIFIGGLSVGSALEGRSTKSDCDEKGYVYYHGDKYVCKVQYLEDTIHDPDS